MTLRPKLRQLLIGLPTGLALSTLLTTVPAYAAATVNKGDTAWMLIATILVILMTIPGLALFYAGLVRTKNVLSVLMQVFICFCMISVLCSFTDIHWPSPTATPSSAVSPSSCWRVWTTIQ